MILIGGLGWILAPRLKGEPIRDPLGLFGVAQAGESDSGRRDAEALAPPAEGRVRVLVSAREIPAYSRVSRDDLYDPERETFAHVDVAAEMVEKNGIFVDAGDIVGRVLKAAKRPGYVFTEGDFLPKGTRPGLAGGVPNGKRAVRIEVGLVTGIIGLNLGDRFDLVAAKTVSGPTAQSGPAFAGVYREMMKQRTRTRNAAKRARVDVLVQNGIVVTPLETRLVPTTSTTLTSGTRTTTRPVQEMVIALDPSEVAPLMAALSSGADITCVARSGRPGEPEFDLTPGYGDEDEDDGSGVPKSSDMHVVEVIQGGERVLVPVPRRSGSEGEDEEGTSAEGPGGSMDDAAGG
ncbi:MAG: hypothetical protein AAF726_07145 [Planctomycetota bacterium]